MMDGCIDAPIEEWVNHYINNVLYGDVAAEAQKETSWGFSEDRISLHKKGDVNDSDNYRGMSLLSIKFTLTLSTVE